MPRHYFIKTFGCQMNEYDSARMADVLRAGAELTATDDPARGRRAAHEHLLGAREGAGEGVLAARASGGSSRPQRPDVIIGVGGCVASQEGEAITARAPFVDLVFGPQTLHRLPRDDRASCAAPAARWST